jgi:hypothetical protein
MIISKAGMANSDCFRFDGRNSIVRVEIAGINLSQ